MRLITILILMVGASGCDLSIVNQELDRIWNLLTGTESPTVAASPSPVVEARDEILTSDAAKNAKANAEILKEMMFIVFMREPKDRGEFGNWTDTLNQGASIEGVYNGLTHSSDYRKLEIGSPVAGFEVLKAFAEELAYIESELPVPSQFDLSTSSPLPTPEDPNAPSVPSETTSSPKPDIQALIPALKDKYAKQFAGSSIFTLKRVLADESLKLVGIKLPQRDKLAIWYSKWAVRTCQLNVDFGIPLRNKPDEGFHFKFALESPEDRVKWEVLNRVHRIINEANKPKAGS